MGARPQPDRVHRGEHSYTVRTAVSVSGERHEVLVDVLLRNKAYCDKKAPDRFLGRSLVALQMHGSSHWIKLLVEQPPTCDVFP